MYLMEGAVVNSYPSPGIPSGPKVEKVIQLTASPRKHAGPPGYEYKRTGKTWKLGYTFHV